MDTIKVDAYRWTCDKCGKVITTLTQAQMAFNKSMHEYHCGRSAENIVKEVKEKKR